MFKVIHGVQRHSDCREGKAGECKDSREFHREGSRTLICEIDVQGGRSDVFLNEFRLRTLRSFMPSANARGFRAV